MRIVKACVAMLTSVTIISQLGELHFIVDNLSNFRVHCAVAFLICAAVLLVAGNIRWLVLSGIGLAVNLVPVVPWYFPESGLSDNGATQTVKILVSNVYRRNTDYGKLTRLLEEEKPEVVALVEVNSGWLANVPALRAEYAFRFEAPHDQYIGLALYSKLPLSDSRIVHFGESAPPAIVSLLHTPEGVVEFILAHPVPPMNAALTERRNTQLRNMAHYVRTKATPVLLAGDLNVTMWNPNYRLFAEHSGLHNARAGYGTGPTWPAVLALGIPIDHILATTPSRLTNFRVHQSIGSDHLPISAELSLTGRSNARESTDLAQR